MGRKGKPQLKRGLWKPEEDLLLTRYIQIHGEGNWSTVSKSSGLKRGGRSCRLRWKNYLQPNLKRGDMSLEEEDLIIRMHKLLGNRWSLIAGRLPGRTDNEVKNYWNNHLKKKFSVVEETLQSEELNNATRNQPNCSNCPKYYAIEESSSQENFIYCNDTNTRNEEYSWLDDIKNLNYEILTDRCLSIDGYVWEEDPFLSSLITENTVTMMNDETSFLSSDEMYPIQIW